MIRSLILLVLSLLGPTLSLHAIPMIRGEAALENLEEEFLESGLSQKQPNKPTSSTEASVALQPSNRTNLLLQSASLTKLPMDQIHHSEILATMPSSPPESIASATNHPSCVIS